MTRRTLTGSATQEVDRAAQALVEPDLWAVAEQLLRLSQVGPGVPDVRGARLEIALHDGLAEDLSDRVRHRVHAHRGTGRDVEDLAARSGRLAGAQRGVDDVADVGEV